MGLPASPLDKIRESVCPLNTEVNNFLDNVQLYKSSAQFLSYGAAIFLIILRQKDINRGFDDASCRKVIENLEKSRYLAGMLIQSFYHFESQFEKQLEYEKKRDEHINRVKAEDTQDDLIKKMLKNKFNRTSYAPVTKESKINIKRLTENDEIGKIAKYGPRMRRKVLANPNRDNDEQMEGFSTR